MFLEAAVVVNVLMIYNLTFFLAFLFKRRSKNEALKEILDEMIDEFFMETNLQGEVNQILLEQLKEPIVKWKHSVTHLLDPAESDAHRDEFYHKVIADMREHLSYRPPPPPSDDQPSSDDEKTYFIFSQQNIKKPCYLGANDLYFEVQLGTSELVYSCLPISSDMIKAIRNRLLPYNTNKKCPICMSKYVATDTVRKLSCGHHFHSSCIYYWFTKGYTTCPVCRHVTDQFVPSVVFEYNLRPFTTLHSKNIPNSRLPPFIYRLKLRKDQDESTKYIILDYIPIMLIPNGKSQEASSFRHKPPVTPENGGDWLARRHERLYFIQK
ncbi:hypothetical protein HELRODRAFT_191301 [Helobdella robusta]|uniref:RING-type domain-containing protein n=1 Tax=Helobdella robusta TaxID=6412 RepID=T1FSV1_HELRO|nr:hypothetical protein HELRODRAFT_191301 [Helobdella robusta]ESO05472.1 hypothetical protein HELRODRAFT_191301 [Helobdella robusta]